MKAKVWQYGKFQTLGLSLSLVLLVGCSRVMPPKIDIPQTAPAYVKPKKVDVALVLGAGGSRAFAHLGVIEVLEEAGVPIDLIVGSSAGSIMGALYADNPNARELKEKVINLKRKDLLDPSITALLLSPIRVTGPVQGLALQNFILKELRSKNFEELTIPLVAVATNVDNNRMVLLRSGPIAPAVNASSALPPVFAPVKLYSQTLVDGGVIAPVPVQVARGYNAKLVIAVDISTPPSEYALSNAFELLYRSLHISFYELSRQQTREADVFIHPNLEGYGTFDDEYNVQLYEKGKATAHAAMGTIKKALKRRGIKLKKRLAVVERR